MNYSFLMRGREPVRYLQRIVEGLALRQRRTSHALAQRFTFKQLGNDVRSTLMRADMMYNQDVGMIERTGGLRLLLEATQTFAVL